MRHPFINLKINDIDYEHKLTIRGISTLENGGVDIYGYIKNEAGTIQLAESLSILYVSLKDKPADLTLDKYIDLVEEGGIDFITLLKKAQDIVINAFPDKKEEDTESPN